MPDPYSRIYWRFRDEYPDIYQDDAALGAWVRLLMIAEGAHPSAADLPRKVKPALLGRLVDEGLVTLYPGERFRIKGLERERERRSDAARIGADKRWQSDRSANAMQTHSDRNANGMPRRDETRRAETRQDEASNAPAPTGFDHLGAIEQVTLLPASRIDRKTLAEFDRLADQRGSEAVAIAIREVAERIPTQPPSARQLMLEVLRVLEPFTEKGQAAIKEAEVDEHKQSERTEALAAITWKYRRGEITADEERTQRMAVLGGAA